MGLVHGHKFGHFLLGYRDGEPTETNVTKHKAQPAPVFGENVFEENVCKWFELMSRRVGINLYFVSLPTMTSSALYVGV